MISIIIPTFNELNNIYIKKILKNITNYKNTTLEVIVVDSNSVDGNINLIKQYPVKLILTHKKSRAARLNIGVANSHGNNLLLHHPRSIFPEESIGNLINKLTNINKLTWGGLTHKFDKQHYFLKFISWYSNNIRVLRKKIVYLDHCIFLSSFLAKKVFPIPEVNIFEDTIISKRLVEFSNPILLPITAKTSAIRFLTNGIYKQWLINQSLKILFNYGFSHKFMNNIYEKNCALNSPKGYN